MKKLIQMSEEKNLTLEDGFELWIANCKRRGLTENTLNYYHTVSEIFMKQFNYKMLLSDINKKTIDTFVTNLMDNGTKLTSLNTYLRGMRATCYWWMREEYIQPFKIERIRCDEEIKETFSEWDINTLLKKPNLKKCSFLEYESWVLCNVFYGLGARASTICGMKIEDLDLSNNQIYYRKVKDRKQTIIPLGDTLVSILKEYLTYRKGTSTDYVFVNSFGDKLSVDRVNEILNRYYKSRKVTKTGVHIWRRTFAKNYIVSGGSALKLQAQLCHKTLDMTKKYVSLYGKDIRDDEHNPLEQMSKKREKMTMDRGGK